MSKKKSMDEMLDEFRGQGGSYTVDPETGAKTLVERTQPAEDKLSEEKDDGTAQA